MGIGLVYFAYIWNIVTSFLILMHQVVSRESAILGDARENRDSIHADHVGMSKFSTTSDPGYKKIVHAMEVLLEGIQDSENELPSGNQSM